MSNYTKGQWSVLGAIVDGDPYPEIAIGIPTPEGPITVGVALGGLVGQQSNAMLMAAAPDLLEALKKILPHMDDLICYASTTSEYAPNKDVAQAIAAIRKATGEQA